MRLQPFFYPFFDPTMALFLGVLRFSWPKTRHHVLKMGTINLFEHFKWSGITFGRMCFGPIFNPFLAPKRPIFKAFWDF